MQWNISENFHNFFHKLLRKKKRCLPGNNSDKFGIISGLNHSYTQTYCANTSSNKQNISKMVSWTLRNIIRATPEAEIFISNLQFTASNVPNCTKYFSSRIRALAEKGFTGKQIWKLHASYVDHPLRWRNRSINWTHFFYKIFQFHLNES